MKFDVPADEQVVLDLLPIIRIGSTNSYQAEIPEDIGRIPFHTMRFVDLAA